MFFDPTFYGGAILGIIALGFAAAPMMMSSVMVLITVELCEQLVARFQQDGNQVQAGHGLSSGT